MYNKVDCRVAVKGVLQSTLMFEFSKEHNTLENICLNTTDKWLEQKPLWNSFKSSLNQTKRICIDKEEPHPQV